MNPDKQNRRQHRNDNRREHGRDLRIGHGGDQDAHPEHAEQVEERDDQQQEKTSFDLDAENQIAGQQ